MSKKRKDRFLQALQEQIEFCEMISAGDRCLAAVSGGADSMALLHGLVKLREAGVCAIKYLHVAHLDHGLRGAESGADAEFVGAEGRRLGLEVTVGKVDVAKVAQETGESMEAAAREQRYEFLVRIAQENKCNKIALGHNADDNAETVLHRIIRGTGVRGLAGIPAKRKLGGNKQEDGLELIRPLLNIRRSEIEAYLKERGIEYRQDSSNRDTEYTRNRIRHELIPQLAREYNPKISEVLLQLAQTADWLGEMLSEDAARTLGEMMISSDRGEIVIDAGKLSRKNKLEQAEVIHQVLLELKAPLRKVGFRHIGSVQELVKSGGAKVQLPGGLVVCREGDRLIFRLGSEQMEQAECPELGETVLMVPGTTLLESGWVWLDGGQVRQVEEIEAQWFEGGKEDLEAFRRRKTPAQEMVDLDKIEGKLVLRQRREGERFRPLGAAGEKKLGDFFTDAKVAQEVRDRVGLICDDRGIVWVMGMRIAERVKVTGETKRILKLNIG